MNEQRDDKRANMIIKKKVTQKACIFYTCIRLTRIYERVKNRNKKKKGRTYLNCRVNDRRSRIHRENNRQGFAKSHRTGNKRY